MCQIFFSTASQKRASLVEETGQICFYFLCLVKNLWPRMQESKSQSGNLFRAMLESLKMELLDRPKVYMAVLYTLRAEYWCRFLIDHIDGH